MVIQPRPTTPLKMIWNKLFHISLKVMQKKNFKRQDHPWNQYIKQYTRHYIETVFSNITCVFPKSIHAVTSDGFLLKLQGFILAFTLQQAFLE
ncbi:MAG: hypothetical protein V7K48_05680 [Nostoc sp.]